MKGGGAPIFDDPVDALQSQTFLECRSILLLIIHDGDLLSSWDLKPIHAVEGDSDIHVAYVRSHPPGPAQARFTCFLNHGFSSEEGTGVSPGSRSSLFPGKRWTFGRPL